MTQSVITVEDLSKAFQLYASPADFLRELLFRKPRHDLFWALRDISFSVTEKQRVGIIGPNGAGKSTLLQILTGNLTATSGRAVVDGRVSALLSLVPSWNSEETGIENIRFNLVLQGCPSSRISSLTEDIVEFTELGSFIYQPVKTYSTGMGARLAFAIATSMEPDILIIDEILASGDAYFVGKAYARMLDFCNRGRALLFVSHSMDAIRNLCDTVIWLQNGTVRQIGRTEIVLKNYEEDYRRKEDETLRSGNIYESRVRRNLASPDTLVGSNFARFRIVPESGGHFSGVQYVRRVCVALSGGEPFDLPLEICDLSRPDVPGTLDVVSSEWGRIFTKRGHNCRTVERITGRQPGAHFTVRIPPATGSIPATITIETMSEAPVEGLRVDCLNMKTGAWERTAQVACSRTPDGWQSAVLQVSIVCAEPEQIEIVREKLRLELRPPIEIRNVMILVVGTPQLVVRERQPFCVRVDIAAREIVPRTDVGIKIVSAEGLYVFWQSSGLDGSNLVDLSGEASVMFHFEENHFRAGQYEITAYVANGWDFPRNYPYSHVYCREVSMARFSVQQEYSGLDFGIVNSRARVEVLK